MDNIKTVLNFLNKIPRMIGELGISSMEVDVVQDIRKIIYEWKNFKDLEKQEKLIKLPCKF